MPTPYIPPGYIGIIKGVLFVAALRNRERWDFGKMLPNEAAIWEALPQMRYPEFIENLLLADVPREARENDSSLIERVIDYREARADIRTALAEDKLRAYFFDEKGEMHHVLKEGWRSDAGQEILEHGYARLEGESTPRFLLLYKSALLGSLVGVDGQQPSHGSPPDDQPTTLTTAPDAMAGARIAAVPRNVQAVLEAMRVIWSPDGRPHIGLHWEKRNAMIREELAKTGRQASDTTIKRALRLLE